MLPAMVGPPVPTTVRKVVAVQVAMVALLVGEEFVQAEVLEWAVEAQPVLVL
jgi:hypothetical protein